MSDVQTAEPITAPVMATEPTNAAIPGQTEAAPAVTDNIPSTEAVASPVSEELKSESAVAGTVPPTIDETSAATTTEEPTSSNETPAAAEKSIEPITEGQLAYKGPGLLKSLVPSKKEFWLSDSPVTPQHLDLYLRGEKPEVSHAVVAWASQTGKGLLFFNKKGETDRTRPASVLPLYDAVDLKKAHPHEITFKIGTHPYTLKASSDAERDGWLISLERTVEVGKAEKESIRASEGYKAEMEKLNKPNTFGATTGAAAAARGRSQPKKSTEVAAADKATEEPSQRVNSDAEDEAKEEKKAQKSRSTSRGLIERLKGKKDEVEAKREEKKEEKEEAKEEKKLEENTGDNKEAHKVAEAAVPAAVVAGGVATVDATHEDKAAESKPEEPAAIPSTETTGTTTQEKAKKRGSIFGRVQSGWSSIKSPTKEKSEKEAELKPVVPPKDTVVSETAPQIPEPVNTETAEPAVIAAPVAVEEPTEPKTDAPAVETPKETEATSPKEKSGNFLSNFLNKRSRSVSPAATKKEVPAKAEETAAIPAVVETPVKEEEAATAPVEATPAMEESQPAAETAATTEAPVETAEATEKPAEKVEEPAVPKTTEAATPASKDKRQSVFGQLGRRASKAIKGISSPGASSAKKENVSPAAATEAKKVEEPAAVEETSAAKDVESKPAATEEAAPSGAIGDVVPEAVSVGAAPQSTPTVAASA